MATKRIIVLASFFLLWGVSPAWSNDHIQLGLVENFQNPFLASEVALAVAHRSEANRDWSLSAQAWGVIWRTSPDLSAYARHKRLQALAKTGEKLSSTDEEWLISGPFPGARASAVANSVGTPRFEARVRSALASSDREVICTFLRDTKTDVKVPDAFFGGCTRADEANWNAPFRPSSSALAWRGRRMHDEVRFRASNEAYTSAKLNELPVAERCSAQFYHAQSVFRLRRRDDAEQMHRNVVETCGVPEAADSHVRALYAAGKRRFDVGDPDESEGFFKTLVATYPTRSHADDAWMYLARIARIRGDSAREDEILDHVVAKLSNGDMLFEIVWEVLEKFYRSGDYKTFLARLKALSLPEHDSQYFSQGRLEYFAGRASQKLKKHDEARAYFDRAWLTYPASFYGGLSALRMLESGHTPSPFRIVDSSPRWLSPEIWTFSAVGRLVGIGRPEWAADFSQAWDGSDTERWQKAYASHLAGRFAVSHNTVRRRIDKMPWLDSSGVANRTQWGIAWPNPFATRIQKAVDAEAQQAGRARLHPALPVSIMREESSFIEDIESYAGALGLMQLMPKTALGHDDDVDGPATPDRLKTADVNIRVGVDHLFWLARRFDDHPVLIAAAYNAGAGAVGKWLKQYPNDDIAEFVEDIPPLQTRDYTKRVIGSYIAYQLMEGMPVDPRLLTNPPKP